MAKKRGFTLVELLVVIAIIALLMAMLMPALRQAQRQAKAVMCQANLKQWALIFAMYTNDYEGNFMEGWTGAPSIPGKSNHWYTGKTPDPIPDHKWSLEGYIGVDEAEELALCPMATKSGSLVGEHEFVRARYTAWCGPDFCGSYGLNGWVHNPEPSVTSLWDGPNERPCAWNWRNANTRGANFVPMFFDCRHPCPWPDDWNVPPETDCVPPGEYGVEGAGEMGRVCINRHNGYINGAFLDFTVRRIGLKELWTLKWHRNFKTNNIYTTAGGMLPEDWPPWMRNFRDYE